MKIEPTYVTFEQAKWLKEKKWKTPTNCYYFEDGEFRQYIIKDTYGYYGEEYTVELEELQNNWNDNFVQKKNGDRCFGCSKSNGYFETYSAPEQWQVVEWLRVNHDIWVWVLPHSTLFRPYAEELINKDRFGIWEGHKYNSPQKAYSVAFDYIKDNNLI